MIKFDIDNDILIDSKENSKKKLFTKGLLEYTKSFEILKDKQHNYIGKPPNTINGYYKE